MQLLPRFGATLSDYAPPTSLRDGITRRSLLLTLQPGDKFPVMPPDRIRRNGLFLQAEASASGDVTSFGVLLEGANPADSIYVDHTPVAVAAAIKRIIRNATGDGLTEDIKDYFIRACDAA